MKTYLFTLILFMSIPFAGSAQNINVCGADAARKQLIQEHPEVLQDEIDLEQFTKDFVANYSHYNVSRSGNIIIPVVFHIIHQGGSENISDAQVVDEIRILNEDYNKRNADTAQVIPTFQSIVANIGIEFRLANLDPNGNCTNGIDRINSVQTYMGNDFSKYNTWPREKYLNVWVVKSMMNGVAGYAYYPGSVQAVYNTPAMDGVIILSNYIGAIGTGNYALARALTHEIGHYLNLKHPWGDTNNPGIACGDDEVGDTPETRGSTTCNLALQFCNPGTIENVQNYMDYSYCSKMFTENQKARMLAALNSNKANRNNLYTATNLVATGTDDLFTTPCAPVADFGVTKRYVCLGSTTTFLAAAGNGDVTDYYWEFPNGSPAISADKNPVVEFLVPGWQPVKLTITGPLGNSVKTNNMLVYVGSDIASYIAPFYQNFEDDHVLLNNEWVQANYDQNNTEFKYVNYASHSGSGSVQLNNYVSHADHDIDEIITPGYNLAGLSTADLGLSFYYSWASSFQSGPNPPDSMEVLATSNCGLTWINVYKKAAWTALNAGAVTGFFTPTQASAYWQYVKINLPVSWKQPNVRFKFRIYSSAHGNNFYLDDVNIGAITTGVQELSAVTDINIFPNPTEGDATLSLSLATAGKVSINIINLTGQQVLSVFEGTLNDGDTQLPVHGSSLLSAGVYVVNVKAGESVVQKKLVIK